MEKIPLPDFEDMDKLANEIGALSTESMVLKGMLKEIEADIVRTVTEDQRFWVKGKSPSYVYIENTYKVIGCDNTSQAELRKLNARLAETVGELEAKKRLFELYMKAIEVWRTQSANERGTFY